MIRLDVGDKASISLWIVTCTDSDVCQRLQWIEYCPGAEMCVSKITKLTNLKEAAVHRGGSSPTHPTFLGNQVSWIGSLSWCLTGWAGVVSSVIHTYCAKLMTGGWLTGWLAVYGILYSFVFHVIK